MAFARRGHIGVYDCGEWRELWRVTTDGGAAPGTQSIEHRGRKVVMTNPTENRATLVAPQLEHFPRPCILLADDDVEMRMLLALTLKGEGYEVVECANGAEILEQFPQDSAATTSPRLALLVTDLRMPGISGLELLGRLRHRRGVPPVILITAFGDEQTHLQARQLGAAASLDKPFEIPCFLALVRTLLSRPAPLDHTTDNPADPV